MSARLFLPLKFLSHFVLRPQQTNTHNCSRLVDPPSVIAPSPSSDSCLGSHITFNVGFRTLFPCSERRKSTPPSAVALSMFSESSIIGDVCATALSACIALSLLRFWEETAKRGLFDQKLNRKLVHVSTGLAFMLCWPLFSSGRRGSLLAALLPSLNIIKMLVLGLELQKDEATVKSMTRSGDCRELLKGPLYYASTITLASVIYWRTSPIAVAAICNLCAGDGLADIVGRRFGSQKLPYNVEKSIVGSIAMVVGGFIASVGYMHYFSSFGYITKSWGMILNFFIVSAAAALVESHPLSTEFDDNLTVPLASVLVGSFLFSEASAVIN